MIDNTQSVEEKKPEPKKYVLLPIWVAVLVFCLSLLSFTIRGCQASRAEKRNVSRALLTEIHQVNFAIYRRLKFWTDPKKVKPDEWLPPLSPFFTDTYDHIGDKIGILDEDLAQAIVDYYGYISFTNQFQKFREEYVKKGKDAEFYKRYRSLLNKHMIYRGDKEFQKFYKQYNLTWPKNGFGPEELIKAADKLIEKIDEEIKREEKAALEDDERAKAVNAKREQTQQSASKRKVDFSLT